MKFIELTAATNGGKIKFKVDDIVAMVDHVNTTGETHETMAFVWIRGMQEAFSVKESSETVIERMKELLV